VAVLIVGLCVGGLFFSLHRLTKGKIFKSLTPVAAGVAMISYMAYYDYDWHDFKAGKLPAGSKIFDIKREASFFKPWGFVVAPVSEFTVFDGRKQLTEQNGEFLIEYMTYTFIKDPLERLQTRYYLLNCNTLERVEIDRENEGRLINISKLDADQRIVQMVCAERG
jgi:hypothetical protein